MCNTCHVADERRNQALDMTCIEERDIATGATISVKRVTNLERMAQNLRDTADAQGDCAVWNAPMREGDSHRNSQPWLEE